MAIYQVKDEKLEAVAPTKFSLNGIRERNDLQRLLRAQIEVISPDTLVIAEEFGEWEDSRRRIDLLGLDKQANLVVIELKRTEDGGHMELQAIRYAAMISTLTFSKVVDIYGRYLEKTGSSINAESSLLEFLEWEEAVEEEFAREIKIVLASAEFSKELTTTVMWLNNNGLDICCIRLKPYLHDGTVLLDVQQVIPLPEAEEYQVSIRNKSLKEKESRNQTRDLTKYTVTTGQFVGERLPKRRAIFQIVKYLADGGIRPEELAEAIPWRNNPFQSFGGHMDSAQFESALLSKYKSVGKESDPARYFIADHELIYANGNTYAFHKMWGTRTSEAMKNLVNKYNDRQISFRESE